MGESSDSPPSGSTTDEPDQPGADCEASQDAQVVERPEAPATPPTILDPFGSPETPRRSPVTPLKIGVPPPIRLLYGGDTTLAREWGRAPAPSALESPTRETPISHQRPPPSLLANMRPVRRTHNLMPEAPAPLAKTNNAPEAPEPPEWDRMKHFRISGGYYRWDHYHLSLQKCNEHCYYIHYHPYVELYSNNDSRAPMLSNPTPGAPVPQTESTTGDTVPWSRKEKRRRKKKGVSSLPSG